MSFPTRKTYPSTFPAAAAAASASTSTANATSLQWSQPCRQFKISEILSATKNFDASLVIGKGGQAKVYKGNIMIGSSVVVVAIKRLERQDTTSFNDEVNMLSKLRHCNLVSLIGYCNNGNEMILVYEYMCQGTLEEHLHKQSTPLSWIQRLKISIDAARGLDYLHTGTGIDSGVIHRDVKSSNILLHEKFFAKISDFGLSKLGPRNQSTSYVFSNVRGTCGYLDPDYINSYNVDWRCDVYSFGVVLLEMLGRKRALDFNRGSDSLCLLAKWGQNHINEGMLTDMVDSGIRDQISPQCLDAFLRITERCFLVGSDRKRRPTMAEVVSSLESVLNLQEKTNNSPALQTPTGRTISRKFDKRPFTGHGDHSAHGDPKPPSNMFSDQKIPNSNLKVFSFGDLEKATSNFSRDAVLSDISFGRVFLGWVDKKTFRSSKKGVGIPVAIKRRTHATRLSSIGHAQWLAEANLLGHLSHPNIIRLFGYCNHEQEYLLVYEYMHNESLDKFLHKSRNSIGNRLSWTKLLTILIGVARGINYLHSSRDQIIHHDIRSSSILLDEQYNAKLGGFELATSGPQIRKTHVYRNIIGSCVVLAPEYAHSLTGHLSVKCDIFSFGMVLLETLSGLQGKTIMHLCKGYEPHSLAELPNQMSMLNHSGNLNFPQEGVFTFITMASKCLSKNPEDRPSSEGVLWGLEDLYGKAVLKHR